MKVNTLKLNGPDYPQQLANIPDPPAKLYWLGEPPDNLLNRPKIAIVGSRKISIYGRQVTQDFAGQLARTGVLIISGLALGVDSIAHRTALDAGGLTMAVLGSAINEITPTSHRQLAEDILKSGGAIASEYPLGADTYPVNFIARNRIVSGLADCLLITEAAAASGTMHTARFALEQGKTVMVIPGNITSSSSEGCNNLLKAGATPVTKIEDIFFAMNLKPEAPRADRKIKGSRQEQLIFTLISGGAAAQEELAAQSGLDGAQLSGTLTILEINGHIRAVGSGNWAAN